MHRFLLGLDDRDIISRHPHELTIATHGRVAKAIRAQWASAIRLPAVEGVPPWRHLHWLTPEEVDALALEGERWLLAVRDHIEGRTLREAWLNERQARNIALRLTYRLRDLHEQGLFHGDLQPSNVVIDVAGDVWLIDVALLETAPGAGGHVAGSAPLMAPELWEGGPPSIAADVYAHGCLIAWLLSGHYPHRADDGLAGWAGAHQGGILDLDDLPPGIAGVVRRMLARAPRERAALQELVDALLAIGAEAPLPPTSAPPTEVLPGLDELLADQGAAPCHIAVFAPRASGKSRAADRLALREAHARRRVVLMRGARAVSTATHAANPPDGPWSPVLELLRGLGEARGIEAALPSLQTGDRLHALERLTQTVLESAGDEALLVVWDDFDQLRPDAQAWWAHFRDALDRRACRVSTVVFGTEEREVAAVRQELQAPSRAYWNRWRATTLRAEVRGISQARWEQLISEHGATIGGFLAALGRETGSEGPARRSRRDDWDTATLHAASAGWREEVARLHEQCAFGEVVELCRGLHRGLQNREGDDEETSYELLRAWTEATIGGGGSDHTAALDAALAARGAEARFALLHARLLNALGHHDAGLARLSDVVASTPAANAEVAVWRAQLALSAGRLDEAREHAERGIASADEASDAVRAHLELLRHAPSAMRGDREAIDALAALAPRLEAGELPHLLRARLFAYRAIGLGRADALEEATDAHLRALDQIEQGGLAAELPTYLLNVGTAYHRQGRLGLAREYYARGLRVAQPTTRPSTRALLFANQANVDLALGRLEEADELVRRGLEIARRGGLDSVEVMCRSVAADIQLARGDADGARRAYHAIADDETLRLRPNQSAEVRLALAEASLQLGDAVDAGKRLDDARRLIEEHGLDDLEHHLGMLRARLQWAEGDGLGTMAGIERFRRHLLAAHAAGNHRLVLRESPFLGAELEREGLDELALELGDLVQDARNAVATGLGRDLRREFFAQLPIIPAPREEPTPTTPRPPPAPASAAQPAGPAGRTFEPFYRMLSLNEVILHASRLDEMLREALAIAASLSGAERAFVLLRDPDAGRIGSFTVAETRGIDGQPIPRPHLVVSRTIAEEAARTGRTVVALNAREDGRFSHALSVVDLDLTSVLCVPIRDASGLVGALYLDHRFQPGVFQGEIPRMMEAFGHQLALAINNARRIAELERERSHLDDARAQLAALVAEREAELEGLSARVIDLSEQVARASSDASLRKVFPDIAFGSGAMQRVLSQVQRVARGDIPVVVTGESGVGKELIARAIHAASPRKSGPFVAFNCGAVNDTLFESEMFGHVKGAFTGADIDRQGLFAAADGGTIFLDEVGEMPPQMQVKLLRVLQERQIRRVGESTSRPIDVRVVAATNRDLAVMVAEEDFREDLYYRLAAFVIEVPPLRERRDDIPFIATKLVEQIAEESGRPLRLDATGARLLRECDWPGNVRELENTLRTAAVLADGEELSENELAPLVRVRSTAAAVPARHATAETRGRRRKARRDDVVEALRRASGDRERAADALGVSPRTLYRYLKRWDLYD